MEFTLVLVPLLLVLFGIMELGVVMYDKITVIQDAREAARLAAVNDPAGLNKQPDVPAGSPNPTFACTLVSGSGNTSANVGDKITATVTYSHSWILPFLPSVIPGLPSTLDLTSHATMRLEGKPTAYASSPGCS